MRKVMFRGAIVAGIAALLLSLPTVAQISVGPGGIAALSIEEADGHRIVAGPGTIVRLFRRDGVVCRLEAGSLAAVVPGDTGRAARRGREGGEPSTGSATPTASSRVSKVWGEGGPASTSSPIPAAFVRLPRPEISSGDPEALLGMEGS